MVHPMLAAVEALEGALEEAAPDADTAAGGMSALAPEELHDIAERAWRVIQRVQGSVLLPTVAEADQRRLFAREEYASASSMRDLIGGWLRCPPATASRLLKTAKHCVNGSFATTGAALAAGDIDADHAKAVVDAVRRVPTQMMNQGQREQAEATMLDTARVTDAEVTKVAGHRLLEVVAPDAAAEHADRQAERDRRRAEDARWLEVTGFGIAGAKELRLRAESEVIDAFMRLVASLAQPSPVDQSSTEESADDLAAETTGAAATGGSPGSAADGSLNLRPVERRRADAAVEVIDTCARPDLLDDLTGRSLRELADRLDGATSRAAAPWPDGLQAGGLQTDGTQTDVMEQHQAWPSSLEGTGQVVVDACADGDGGDAPGNRDAPGKGRRVGMGETRVRGERPSLIVLANYDHVEGRLRAGTASGPGSPPRLVSASEIERLACEADITPVAMTRNATPVTVASTSRYFRGKQLVALIARDFGCIFPGCSRGLRYSRAHHIVPWAKGGATSADKQVPREWCQLGRLVQSL